MKRSLLLLLIVVGLSAAGLCGYWYGRHAGLVQDSEEDQPGGGEIVAKVQVAPARFTHMTESITAYGTVIARPEQTISMSAPYESQVSRVVVMTGQPVGLGDLLLEAAASPDTILSLQQAKAEHLAAQAIYDQAKQRFDQKMATRSELLQAQKDADAADLKLQSLLGRGIGEPLLLRASQDALISGLDVQQGQIVPAGSPLVQLVARDGIEVKLSVEPEVVRLLHVGQDVSLHAETQPAGEPLTGHVRLIIAALDPVTRMVSVFIAIQGVSPLLLDEYVQAELITATRQTLVVPRQAVHPAQRDAAEPARDPASQPDQPEPQGESSSGLPGAGTGPRGGAASQPAGAVGDGEGAFELFTIVDGKAVRHIVHLGLRNNREVEVLGDAIRDGEAVVVVGNHELEDGMAVEVETAR